jgi:membrane protein DedA with SNARE-associated domain
MSDVELPKPPADRRLTLLGSVVGVLFLVANLGTILSAKLVKSHPAVLLALSSRNRHLLLVKGAGIGVVPFVLIPLLRVGVTALANFLLARDYGEKGKAYLEREAGGLPSTVAWAERLFDKIGPSALILFAGSQLAWLMAGLRRISLRTFVIFEVIGILARVAFFWFLGERFKPQIESFLKVIGKFTWPLTVVLIVTVIYQTQKSMKRTAAQQAKNTSPEGDTP